MTTEQALKESRSALGALGDANAYDYPSAVVRALKAQQTLLESIAAAIAPKPAPPAPKKPASTPFSELVAFDLTKKLAQRALGEATRDDSENLAVREMAPRLYEAKTFEELDALLEDTCEDDWLQGFMRERSLELIEDLLAPLSGKETQS